MEGFLDELPLLVKVTWSPDEVQLLNGKALGGGLLAEIPTPGVDGGVTRYLVPWEAISYIKQAIPPGASGQPPVRQDQPAKTDGDTKTRARRTI